MAAKLEVLQEDITALDVDAITNAANTHLQNLGGVAKVISDAGGPKLQAKCREVAPIGLGAAIATIGGDLPAHYVIHAATMVDPGGTTSAEVIGEATRATLAVANGLDLSSLALVAFGTGVGGFPVDKAAEIMVGVVRAHDQGSLSRIVFAVHDAAAKQAFSAALAS